MGAPGALTRLAVLAAVLALAGCAQQPVASPGPSSSVTGSSAGPSTGSSTGPGGGGVVPPPMDPSLRAGCVASTEEATVRKNEPPAQICLVVGATLHVSSEPSPRGPWQPLSSSDSRILACTSVPGPEGTIDGTCRALRPGTAVLTTTTRQLRGDTRYAPDYLWQLTVRVVA